MKAKAKAKQIEQLQQDLIKYSKQIGILDSEVPALFTNRAEYHSLLVQNNLTKRAGGYGECMWSLKAIFVDMSKRHYHRTTYSKNIIGRPTMPHYGEQGYRYEVLKYTTKEVRKVKATYVDKLNILIHELIHYRFRYMRHGEKYEARINEIIKGKTYPIKGLYQQ